MTDISEESGLQPIGLLGPLFSMNQVFFHSLALGDSHRRTDKADGFARLVALVHRRTHFHPLVCGHISLHVGNPVFLLHFVRLAANQILAGSLHTLAVRPVDSPEIGRCGNQQLSAFGHRLLLHDIKMPVDVANEHSRFQIPLPRRHIRRVQGSGQLVIGGLQHPLRQRQLRVIYTEHVNTPFRFRTRGDDGEIRFRLSVVILKSQLPRIVQRIVAGKQFGCIRLIQFAVFLTQYFVPGQNIPLESGIDLLIDEIDNPAVRVVHQPLTGVHDRHILHQTAVITHNIQPFAALGKRPAQPYHVHDRH